MNKTILLGIFALLIGQIVQSQDLICDDFKAGKFYIPMSEEMEKYSIIVNDSVSHHEVERNPAIKKFMVEREIDRQIEWTNDIGEGDPEYGKIEWLDDCTFRLTYDASKSELDDVKTMVNRNNGLIISKTRIEGRCMFYKATMTMIDGAKLFQNGKICKE